jgi:hypothetical protein
MTLGSALASRPVSDAARRDLPSEWAGPEPSRGTVSTDNSPRTIVRRVIVRKP